MAKRELDNLDLDMIQCKADGFGCNYGLWKALQKNPVVRKKKELPLDMKTCPVCGKSFRPKNKGRQIYCEFSCQQKAQKARDKGKYSEYYKNYAAKRRAERKLNDEVCTG